MLTTRMSPSNLGMEEPPLSSPRTPVANGFRNGDLVQVFHGTGAYVEGRKTVAYIGRIAGYNEALGKWEVLVHLFPPPPPNPKRVLPPGQLAAAGLTYFCVLG